MPIIDADAMLSGPIALQSFQAVAWRSTHIAKRDSCLQLIQLSQCNPLHSAKFPRGTSLKELASVSILEAENQLKCILLRLPLYVKRQGLA